MIDPEPSADWRARLGRGGGGVTGSGGSGAGAPGSTGSGPAGPSILPPPNAELALLFQLRAITRTGSQWTAPKAEPAAALEPGREHRLAVRPALRSATGNWTTGSVGWGSLGFTVERLRLDPAQVRWFGQFAALHRAGSDGYRAHEPDWLYLDDLAGPVLWPLLAEAQQLGIRFAGGVRGGDGEVRLAGGAAVVVELLPDRDARGASASSARGDADGASGAATGVIVHPVARVDGAEVAPSGLLGEQGLYVWDAGRTPAKSGKAPALANVLLAPFAVDANLRPSAPMSRRRTARPAALPPAPPRRCAAALCASPPPTPMSSGAPTSLDSPAGSPSRASASPCPTCATRPC